MVFSSIPFLFLFLPLVVALYYALIHYGWGRYCWLFLLCSSLFYYAYWKWVYVSVILLSMTVNFVLAQCIFLSSKNKKLLFVCGLFLNILALVVFKYTDFFIGILNSVSAAHVPLTHILLPIGISFYTFQQISYLSDVYTGKHDPTCEGIVGYGLFISFFPQLVAGPIVHHREMMPQFADERNQIVIWKNMYTGLCYLSIGLAKKVLIADTLSPVVKLCFDDMGSLTFLEACFASVAYATQLYFDFSGYSDMAIGCALFFNIHLPLNFNSPYKSVNIQDFWRRWHMTLSRWLRDYLYIPLGGNKFGLTRTLGNLFLTFLIGGIWHGAGWHFMLWGALHGAALVIHRLWSKVWMCRMPMLCGRSLTFIFVCFAWVPFRVVSFERLEKFIDAFLGYNGFMIRGAFIDGMNFSLGFDGGGALVSMFMVPIVVVVFYAKNTQELLGNIDSQRVFMWCMIMLALALSVVIAPGYKQEFIYFQF